LLLLISFVQSQPQPQPQASSPTATPTAPPTAPPTAAPTAATPPSTGPPVCSLYGADCSCAHDMNAFLHSLNIVSPTATCAAHTWTYPQSLDIGNQNWNILSDTVVIQGNFSAGPSATIQVSLSPDDASNSGLFSVSRLTSGGNIFFNLLTAPDGDYTIPVVDYASYDNTVQFTPNVPTLPEGFTICRMFKPDSSVIYTANAYNLVVHITDNPTYSCTDGRGDRSWTIAFMVLLSLHAICLLVFCLVTCKKESLKEKIWDS